MELVGWNIQGGFTLTAHGKKYLIGNGATVFIAQPTPVDVVLKYPVIREKKLSKNGINGNEILVFNFDVFY